MNSDKGRIMFLGQRSSQRAWFKFFLWWRIKGKKTQNKTKTVAGWMLRFVSIWHPWHPFLYIGNTVYTSIYIYISCIFALSSKMETFLNSSFANTFFQRSFLFSFLYFIIFSWHICTADFSFKCLCWHIHAFLDKLPQPAVGGSISRTHVCVHETQTRNPLLKLLPYRASPPLINMFVLRSLEGTQWDVFFP